MFESLIFFSYFLKVKASAENGEGKVGCVCAQLLSGDQLLVAPRMQPAELLCLWDSRGKNIGVGCHFLLQVIFLMQGSNLCLLHCRRILYH